MGRSPGVGAALLTQRKIAERVAERQQRLADELGITRQVVLQGLLDEAQNAKAGASRVRAWELLGRAHGLFAERIDHRAQAEIVFKLEMGGTRVSGENVLEAQVVDAVGELGPGVGDE